MSRRLAIRAANRLQARGETDTAGLIYDLLNGTASEADVAAMHLPADQLEAVLIAHQFNKMMDHR